MRRIVLTGGPGAGKTVVAQHLAAAMRERMIVVPEAATQVYSRLGTRWDRLDLPRRREAQRQIYRFQIDQEQRIAAANPERILLLDRGTIDGAAYWPEGPEDYWRDLGTNLSDELARYDAVIWMETCATLGVYDGESSNPVRFEDPAAAIESGRLLARLWGGHPMLKRIEACRRIDEKIAAVMQVLRELNLSV